jgi:hypothetical protein
LAEPGDACVAGLRWALVLVAVIYIVLLWLRARPVSRLERRVASH